VEKNTFCERHADDKTPCFIGILLHPSCEQIVFAMINSGVLIVLVVEWLEEVGCGCEETM